MPVKLHSGFIFPPYAILQLYCLVFSFKVAVRRTSLLIVMLEVTFKSGTDASSSQKKEQAQGLIIAAAFCVGNCVVFCRC